MDDNQWVTITEEDEWETVPESGFRGAGVTGTWKKLTPVQKAGQAIKEAVAAPVRTLESMIGSMGGLMRMGAESATLGATITRASDIPGAGIVAEHLIRKYGPDRALSFYDRKMKKHADTGKKISDFWAEQANKGWEVPNPDIVEARWRDRPVSKTVSAVSSGLTSIGVVLGTTALTKSPHAGLALLAGSETGGMYDRLRNKDVPPDIASKLAQMAGAWTYATEKIGFEHLLKPSAKTFINALSKGGWEGAQEVVEQMGHNLLEYFGYDYRKPQDIPTAVKAATDHMMDGWVDALVGGIGAGGLTHVVIGRGDRIGEPIPTPRKIKSEQIIYNAIGTIDADLPPVKEGHVRLYRGQHPTSQKDLFHPKRGILTDKEIKQLGLSKGKGGWFTPFINYALNYAEAQGKGYEIVYTDVPIEIAEKYRRESAPEGLSPEGYALEYYFPELRETPVMTPPTIEELTKKPIEEIEPQTPDHAIGHQYGLTNEQVDNKLDQTELRYRELKLKETEKTSPRPMKIEEYLESKGIERRLFSPDMTSEQIMATDQWRAEVEYNKLKKAGKTPTTTKTIRTKAETNELAFLSRNRTNIEAVLERETRPPVPPPIKRTQKNLLTLGHKIAREAELTDEEYRDFAEIVTGKRSMGDMSKAERNEFVAALEESYGTPKELSPEDYDIPINIAGRGTSMREVYGEAVKTTAALVDKKKVPATIKIGFGKVGAVQGLKNFFFGIDNTPPYHLARILDGGTEGIFSEVLGKGIEHGRKNTAAHTRAVMNALLTRLQEFGITDADLAKMSKAVNPRMQTMQMINKGMATETFTESINNQNFEMTMANLIDIYLISNQETGIQHLTKGGLVIEGVETGPLSEERIIDLRERVDENPKAKKIVDTILEIGELIWKPSINQVSQRLEGKEIAVVEDWWGLEVYMPKRLAGKTRMGKLGQFGVNLIEDKGILKDRTRSTAPLVVRDAFRRFSVFESAIAEYTGMAEPSRTSRTILNDPSIATALDQKGYNEVRKRILKIHEQAQSLPAFEGNFSAWFAKRLPSLYRAILFFNPRVVASQYTSAFNYGAYASPEFVTKIKDGLSIENSQETLTLSDVAWDRFHMGHSSLELGEATQSDAALRMWTGGKSSDINKAGWAMKVADLGALTAGTEIAKAEYDAARAEKLTGLSAEWWLDKDVLPEANIDLWRKVQEEGENADPEERQAVEQWRKLITDRAEYLWQRTQPSWDRWNRSTLTSQKGIRRLFLLFRSFHEKSLTIFNEAKLDYENSAKTLDDKTRFAQRTGSVLTGYTVNMFLRLAIMAAITRELKEPVKYFEEFLTSWTAMFPIFGKVLKTTVNRFVDTLAGAKPTYIGEAVESYPVRVVNMALKSPVDFAEATAHLVSGDNEEAKEAFERGINRLAEGVGTLSGVPVPEIKRVLPKEEPEPKRGKGPTRRR